MKNAKLSSREFKMSPSAMMPLHDQQSHSAHKDEFRMLSAVQEQFVLSLPSLSAQLEMRFNLSKQWRTYFSNLCIEMGYARMDVSEWIASLEDLEIRAAEAESHMRNFRRRCMGLGAKPIKSSSVSSSATIAAATKVSPTSVPRPISSQSLVTAEEAPAPYSAVPVFASNLKHNLQNSQVDQEIRDFQMDDRDFRRAALNESASPDFDQKLVAGAAMPMSITEDFDCAMEYIMGQGDIDFFAGADEPSSDYSDWVTSENPFLTAIAMYLEERNLPFQYADCWVPSLGCNQLSSVGDAKDDDVRLLPAGFVTRYDQDRDLVSALAAFGEYSKSFSFKPGRGLPGRVYSTGESAWQMALNESHPSIFPRAGGAKIYGLKTAVAMPFSAPGLGRMIVVMYSTERVTEDPALITQCCVDLARYCPQPKWKLIIDVGTDSVSTSATLMEELNPSCLDPSTSSGNKTMGGTTANGVSEQAAGACEKSSEEDMEKKLITLLGDQMPSMEPNNCGEPSSSLAGDVAELLPHIMRMRLMLLRPSSRRSQQDQDVIDVLTSSFGSYTKESRRSDAEIAMLLAREWQCLQPNFSFSPSQTPCEPMRLLSPTDANDFKLPATATKGLESYQAVGLKTNTLSKPLARHWSFVLKPIACQSNSLVTYHHGKDTTTGPGRRTRLVSGSF
jgi:hypothetical protein